MADNENQWKASPNAESIAGCDFGLVVLIPDLPWFAQSRKWAVPGPWARRWDLPFDVLDRYDLIGRSRA